LQLPSLLGNPQTGPFWTVVYTNTDVILKLVHSTAGDYNHNGVVDAADYTVWRDSLGKTGIGLAADGDGNHLVDIADYNVWKTHFGTVAGGGSAADASGAVPEPATRSLALVGLVGLAASFWRTRSSAFPLR
jgi:hypothetical protein